MQEVPMENPQSPTPEVPQQPVIRMVPMSELYVPDWNSRKFKDPSELDDLEAFLRARGKIRRILIWKGNGQAPYAIIDGQRRFLAAQRLGWTQIEAEEVDCTLEEA